MQSIRTLVVSILVVVVLMLCACQSNELTQEEIEIQNKADSEVAALLFDYELDKHASYNVHKDGSVIIKFDRKVSKETYTSIVEKLRDSSAIKSIYATQGGQEVCPLNSIRQNVMDKHLFIAFHTV